MAVFAEHDDELTAIRAFDLFPMTHHVEWVALLPSDPKMNPHRDERVSPRYMRIRH